MNKVTKAIIWIVVLVLVIWGLTAISQKGAGNKVSDTGPIKIGFIGPLTGDAASIGTVARTAVMLSAEEINNGGGVNGRQLEVTYEDGKCNPESANSAANKLINVDGVSAIIGGLCSSETSAFAPQAMQHKTVVISYCSSAPSLTKTGQYFFRDYPSDAYQGKFAAEYAYNTLGARKVAVLYHISDWGTGIKEVFESRFKELGGQIVDEEGSQQTVTDYRTQLAKIDSSHPDYIYSATYPEGGIVMINQAKEMGIAGKYKFLGGDAWGDTKFQKEVSGKANILYVESKTALTDDFKAKILAKTGGEQVPICASQSYDAVKILAQAAASSGTDPDKLQEAIRKTNYDGVSGHIEFDQNGDVTVADYVVKKVENGTNVEVK